MVNITAGNISIANMAGDGNTIGLRFIYLAFVTGMSFSGRQTGQPCQPHFSIPVRYRQHKMTVPKYLILLLTALFSASRGVAVR